MARSRDDSEERARALEESSAELRRRIRVFTGWAGSVIWYARGPVPYELACISDGLAEAMQAWEDHFDTVFGAAMRWPTDDGGARHVARGQELARRLSEEIGDILEVEADADSDGGTVLYRCPGFGTSPRARHAFEEMAREAREEDERTAAWLRGGGGVVWR